MYILIVQPVLTSYRKVFFDALSSSFQLVEVYADLNPGEGFKLGVEGLFKKKHTPVIGNRKKIYYQVGIIKAVLKNKPSAIFITADFRAVHFWLILILANVLKVPIFSHGQGLYNKPNFGNLHKLMFKTVTKLSSQYVCYTDSVHKSLIDIGVMPSKLSVMDNTIVNKYAVKPSDKPATKHRLLYLGRLREGNNLELLFDAMKLLKERGKEIALDIVGDGTERTRLEEDVRSSSIDVTFLGAVYDDQAISEISKKSTIGVYPGDAGLSIVHYMSLSLVPIVHDDLTMHMGPEPSYIESGFNGLTFKRGDSLSLAQAIEYALDTKSFRDLSEHAFETYCSLSKPTMSNKLIQIMSPYVDTVK